VGDLEDAARDHYFKIIKEEGVFIPKDQVPEKDALLAKGLEAAIRLTQLYRQSLAPAIHLTLVEEKLTLDVGLALPLRGTIDVLTRDNRLPDLKTADKSKGAKGGGSLPAAHLLCRPGGPPDGEVAGEGEPGGFGERQRAETAKPP